MPFERQIISRQECPRCGAAADVRVDDSEDPPIEGVIVLVLVCPKCHLKKSHGMTSKAVLMLENKERNLTKALEKNPNSKRIRDKLLDVKNRLSRARLGI